MVEKVIKVLRDFDLKTCFGSHSLVADEVKRIRFKNQRSFNTLLTLGDFVEAERGEKESKNILVIRPKVDEETIVGVEPVDPVDPLLQMLKQKKSTGEETLEGTNQSGSPVEKLTPEQETEGLPEIEEITKRSDKK